MKVIVTGYSGFLGKKVAARLIEEGHSVIGISRTDGNVKGVKFYPIDLSYFNRAFFEDTPIVHCAAVTNEGWSYPIEQINKKITKSALKLSNGLFVNISSSSIYNLATESVNIDELSSKEKYPFFNSYSLSKSVAEELVAASGKRTAITLRPHGIYGEGDTTLLPRLQSKIHFNKIVLPEGGRKLHSLTHVNNLVDAIVLSLESKIEGYHDFNITDREPITVAEAIRKTIMKKLHIINLPLKQALALAYLSEKTVVPNGEPKLSKYSVLQLGMERTYDISKAISILGYNPTGNMIQPS